MHVGGNAYDCYDAAGILIHKYGPHIFHTNSREVFDYLSVHRVAPVPASRAGVGRRPAAPIPINLDTVNQSVWSESHLVRARQFFTSVAARAGCPVRTSEDVDRQQGRPRAVRQVLSQLHAEAVGAGSVGARCVGDRSGSRPYQSRRSLLHRYLPGDAAAWLHAMFERMLIASEHQDHAQYRLPRDRQSFPTGK